MRDTLIYTKLLKINNLVTIADFTKRNSCKQGSRVIIKIDESMVCCTTNVTELSALPKSQMEKGK